MRQLSTIIGTGLFAAVFLAATAGGTTLGPATAPSTGRTIFPALIESAPDFSSAAIVHNSIPLKSARAGAVQEIAEHLVISQTSKFEPSGIDLGMNHPQAAQLQSSIVPDVVPSASSTSNNMSATSRLPAPGGFSQAAANANKALNASPAATPAAGDYVGRLEPADTNTNDWQLAAEYALATGDWFPPAFWSALGVLVTMIAGYVVWWLRAKRSR